MLMENGEIKIENAILKICAFCEKNKNAVIAVDGRCGAGKTTFARRLQGLLDCNVIHTDDFFLPQNMRTEERFRTPGANVHYERIIDDVFSKLKGNTPFSYRPYSCKTDGFGEELFVAPNTVTVVEGSYACHPMLWEQYDMHIFMDIDSETQLERIAKRNADTVEIFKNKWIPLEEEYFGFYNIKEKCDMVIG